MLGGVGGGGCRRIDESLAGPGYPKKVGQGLRFYAGGWATPAELAKSH